MDGQTNGWTKCFSFSLTDPSECSGEEEDCGAEPGRLYEAGQPVEGSLRNISLTKINYD